MGIGASAFLIAAGAILAFAVETSISGIDIAIVGWILMAVGVLGLIATMTIFGPRSRTVADDTTIVERPLRERRVVERDVI